MYSRKKEDDNGFFNPGDALWWRDAILTLPIPNPVKKTAIRVVVTDG